MQYCLKYTNIQILISDLYQEEKEDALARSLRYNVHKNLGECHLSEGDVETAQREMMTAAEIDSGDITLWFKIAGSNLLLIFCLFKFPKLKFLEILIFNFFAPKFKKLIISLIYKAIIVISESSYGKYLQVL